MNKKNVVITGASGGIGSALVYAYHEAGYQVIAVDCVKPTHFPEGIHFYLVDLADEESLLEFCGVLENQYSSLHVLINNAAQAHFVKPVAEISFKDWSQVMDVNLKASFFLAQHFLRMNQDCDYGRIINIGSTRARQNEPDWDLYGSSKGGILGLTASLCVSFSGTGITVNTISPGWIATAHYESLSSEDHKQHPSGRVGRPDDIARACLFLSDEDNGFINGADLVVDGGMTKKMVYI